MTNQQQCPVCELLVIDNVPYFSRFNGGETIKKATTFTEVFSKVCRHAKRPGCLNQCQVYNKNKDFPSGRGEEV
jgi:hypothetical protein